MPPPTSRPTAHHWHVLGAVDYEPGDGTTLTIHLSNLADGPVAADAILVEQYDATPLGPSTFSQFLLDTGATGVVAASEATAELEPNGYQTQGIYREQGVAGFTEMDVSEPYRVDFADATGQRNSLIDFQMLSSETLSFSFLGPWGIFGMPAMVHRVTTFDWSAWTNVDDPNFPIEDLGIKTSFSADLPPDSGHQYHVPLQLVDFPTSGQVGPDGPVPTFAPLPYIPVKIQDDGHKVEGQYLFDTGAQLSIVSTSTATALGLDKNGNGVIDLDPSESVGSIQVGGIGGTTSIPLVVIDRLAVPTAEGDDLVWTTLLAGVEDIEVENGPSLAGVFGMDFLTSGWATKVLGAIGGDLNPSYSNGYFQKVTLDARDADDRAATLIFDVTPEHDVSTAPRTNALTIHYAGLGGLSATTGSGDDTFEVAPSPNLPITLDGGPHNTSDSLDVHVPNGQTATNDGTRIQVPGHQDITYTRIENVNVAATVPQTLQVVSALPSASGFTVNFTKPIDPSTLNLYAASTLGPGRRDRHPRWHPDSRHPVRRPGRPLGHLPRHRRAARRRFVPCDPP